MSEYFVRYNVVAKTPIFKGNLKTAKIKRIRNIEEGYGSFIWRSYREPSEFFEDIKSKISDKRKCEEDEIDIITLDLVYK